MDRMSEHTKQKIVKIILQKVQQISGRPLNALNQLNTRQNEYNYTSVDGEKKRRRKRETQFECF